MRPRTLGKVKDKMPRQYVRSVIQINEFRSSSVEFLAWLIHQIFGKKESVDWIPSKYVSTDVKENVFDNQEDLGEYEEKEALENAKYVYRGNPNYGVLTWSGKGRRPRWVDDYLAIGGSLEEIENKDN